MFSCAGFRIIYLVHSSLFLVETLVRALVVMELLNFCLLSIHQTSAVTWPYYICLVAKVGKTCFFRCTNYGIPRKHPFTHSHLSSPYAHTQPSESQATKKNLCFFFSVSLVLLQVLKKQRKKACAVIVSAGHWVGFLAFPLPSFLSLFHL